MKKTLLFCLVLALLTVPAARAEEGAVDKTSDAKKQAEELVATAKGCVDKAKMLVGDERKESRERQYAAAAEAYGKALEADPGWLLDDAAGKGPWPLFLARQKRGDLWKAMTQYDKARDEYQKGFQYPTPAMLDLRSYIQMTIADSYFEQENWIAAEEAYLKAQKIGLFGDRKVLVPAKLEKVKPLAEAQRKAMEGQAGPKP